MRRCLVGMVLPGVVVVCAAPPAVAGAAEYGAAAVAVIQAAIWGKAIEVPGLGTLNTGGVAEVNSASCPSAGNCIAGGAYSVPAPPDGTPNSGRSWSGSGTASGGRRSRCPAPPR